MEALSPLRDRIDAIDDQILALLNERAEIVLEVGRVKISHDAPLHVPEREAAILNRLTGSNPGPFPNPAVVRVYKELISACLNMEGPIRVAYLGPAATYTHLTALQHFGGGCKFVPYDTIAETVDAVARGDAIYAVVPVENSNQGSVAETLDAVSTSAVQVSGEVDSSIHHCLLSSGEDLARIRAVFGHTQALAQCRNWLREHLNQVELVPTSSNAVAAQNAEGRTDAAAVGPAYAAEVYGLDILAANIEDHSNNCTRFWVISKVARKATGNDKTSLLVSIKDAPGSLHGVLEVFEKHGINLTRIESRPSRQRPWEYLFFVDLAGHPEQQSVQDALAALEQHALWVKQLGAYPMAQEPELDPA